MRIVILTNDFPPNGRGGAGIIAQQQEKALIARGHDVTVLYEPPVFVRHGAIRRLFGHLHDLGARNSLVQQALDVRPEALITHSLTGCGFGTAKEIRSHGVRWIHVLHDVQLFEPSGQIIHGESFPFLRHLWRRMWSRVRRRVFGTPDLVLSPSKWLIGIHARYGFFIHADCRVLPNPIPVFENQELAEHVQDMSDDILFVGRLDSDKGVSILLEAWRELGEDRPTVHLVGSGTMKESIEQQNDPKIVLHGTLPHERIFHLYSGKPTVVIPSLVFENQPTVILEALSLGCRVIASRVGGIPELLEGGDGILVPPGDVEALKDAILQCHSERSRGIPLKRDPSASVGMTKTILSRHAPESVFDQLESFLKSNL